MVIEDMFGGFEEHQARGHREARRAYLDGLASQSDRIYFLTLPLKSWS